MRVQVKIDAKRAQALLDGKELTIRLPKGATELLMTMDDPARNMAANLLSSIKFR